MHKSPSTTPTTSGTGPGDRKSNVMLLSKPRVKASPYDAGNPWEALQAAYSSGNAPGTSPNVGELYNAFAFSGHRNCQE